MTRVVVCRGSENTPKKTVTTECACVNRESTVKTVTHLVTSRAIGLLRPCSLPHFSESKGCVETRRGC